MFTRHNWEGLGDNANGWTQSGTAFIPDEVSERAKKGKTKRITSQVVSALKPPAAGNRIVWDRDLTGFGVRITAAGAISFILRYFINGRQRRYTIGRHPVLSPKRMSALPPKAVIRPGAAQWLLLTQSGHSDRRRREF